MKRHFFYINDGRVFLTEGENIFAFMVDKDFDGLRAKYVTLNRRPIRNPSYPLPSRTRKLRLKTIDFSMRLYRWVRRQIRVANNKPIYFYYNGTSNNL